MRAIRAVLIVLVLLSWSQAHSDDGDAQIAALLAQFDNGHGELDTKKLQAFYRKAKAIPANPSPKSFDIASKPYAKPKDGETLHGYEKPIILIRKNFTDVFLFDSPTPAAKAAGATLSYERDSITDDDVWSLHGMVAIPLQFSGTYNTDGPYSVIGFNAAPYVLLNTDNHSNDDSKRTVEFGATGEIGFDMGSWSQYFRGRLGVVNDDIADYTNQASSMEWIPVSLDYCLDFPCSVPGTSLIYRLQPSIILQYDHTTSGDNPFSDEQNALRIGPAITLNFQPFGNDIPFLQDIVGNVSYHFDWELYSERTFDWLDASLTYNLTPSGNLGITASYQRGEDEQTAEPTDDFNISLSGKI